MLTLKHTLLIVLYYVTEQDLHAIIQRNQLIKLLYVLIWIRNINNSCLHCYCHQFYWSCRVLCSYFVKRVSLLEMMQRCASSAQEDKHLLKVAFQTVAAMVKLLEQKLSEIHHVIKHHQCYNKLVELNLFCFRHSPSTRRLAVHHASGYLFKF